MANRACAVFFILDLTVARRARQRHTGKWPPHSGAVVVHVPLPGIRWAVVDKRGMEPGRRGVLKEKRNGIAGHTPATNTLRIKCGGARVVHPEAAVRPARWISPEQ